MNELLFILMCFTLIFGGGIVVAGLIHKPWRYVKDEK